MAYQTTLQSKFSHKVAEPMPAFNSDHPIHPAIVHFPIAFNILSWSLDILYFLTTTYWQPDFLTSRFSSPPTLLDINRVSYFLLCAGIIATIPAIMSGNIQLVGMIKKNGGPWEKDAAGKQKSTMVPRIKTAITHAIMNDLIMFVNLYSWYVKRGKEETGWNLGKTPVFANFVIACVLLPALMASSNLGATLVYNHGVGLHLGRKKFQD